MKFLLVSDLHYTLKQLDWVSAVAGQFDLVVIAGDLVDIVSVAARPAQVVVLLKYLKRMRSGAKLIVSSGNHDLDGLNRFGEQGCRWLQRAGPLEVVIDGDCIEMEDTLSTVKTLEPSRFFIVEKPTEFFRSQPEIALSLSRLLAQRLHYVTSYLVDLKAQFEESRDHLGMVDEILESLVHHQESPEDGSVQG